MTQVLPPQGSQHIRRRLAKGGNSEVYEWGQQRVLKLFRKGFPRGAIEAELRYARIAHAAGVPTPHAEGIIEWNERTGIVFERCEGPTLYEAIMAPTAPVERLAQVFFEIQQGIHHGRAPELPPLAENLAAKILRARGVPDAVKRRAVAVMRLLPTGDCMCHGDFHPVNVVMSPGGPTVIDWLDAGRSDAAPDIARTILLLEFARPGQVDTGIRRAFLTAYIERCREAGAFQAELLERWRLPLAIARLAEVDGDAERQGLIDLVRGLSPGVKH